MYRSLLPGLYLFTKEKKGDLHEIPAGAGHPSGPVLINTLLYQEFKEDLAKLKELLKPFVGDSSSQSNITLLLKNIDTLKSLFEAPHPDRWSFEEILQVVKDTKSMLESMQQQEANSIPVLTKLNIIVEYVESHEKVQELVQDPTTKTTIKPP